MTDLIKYDSKYFKPSPAYFSGTATTSLVPYPFPIAVGGHPYMVQWDATAIGVWGAKFKRTSLPLLRQQADSSNTPGEQSISPEQFWRRSQETWHYGKGQIYLDREGSERRRYNDSKGIDPWTPWQLSLLNDTTRAYASTYSNLFALSAGANVYILEDGIGVKFSSDLATWTPVTVSGSPQPVSSITTDGHNLWSARGSSGIYTSTSGATTATSYATGKTVSLVRFCKSRLIAAGDGVLYNITTSGNITSGETLLDLSARNMQWVDVVGGASQIYAAGYAGDKSYIYRTAILPDGTALTTPIIAGQLPDGEIVRSLGEYLGFILIGSDKGVRFCNVNSDGSLTIGSIIETYDPVYCFEGQDRFVWYGLSNYDGDSGLGRMDLTTFTADLKPAYATDLMSKTTGGAVRSVLTFNDARLFTVDGHGLYKETLGQPVARGTLASGVISYGISDPKVATFIDVKHEPLVGTIRIGIINDQSDGDLTVDDVHDVGTSIIPGSVSPPSAFPCGQLIGENFQVIAELNSSGTHSPIMTRFTLRSMVTPVRTPQWDVPILLYTTDTVNDKDWAYDVEKEMNYLIDLFSAQKITTLQVANEVYQVIMYDYQWIPEALDIYGHPRGTFYAQFREIVG